MREEKILNSQMNCIVQYDYDDVFSIEDVEGRRLYINYEIEDEIFTNMVYHILRYNRLDKDKPIEERKPIILYINSPGGSVTAGFGLIDVMLQSETPIYTVNQGTCYSMAFLIFLAGHRRFAMQNSTFLCHDGSSIICDSMSKVKDRIEFETGQMTEHIKKYIMSQTNIDEKLYDDKHRIEWYMYPEEAKDNGIVTHIVGKDCKLSEIL